MLSCTIISKDGPCAMKVAPNPISTLFINVLHLELQEHACSARKKGYLLSARQVRPKPSLNVSATKLDPSEIQNPGERVVLRASGVR